MKNLIVSLSLLISFAASAAEMKVLEISGKTAGRGSLTTRFDVNLKDGTAAVSVKVTRRTGGKNPHTSTRTFSQKVPELALKDKILELSVDGASIDCGTMGVTRVFKLPVLRLSGNCDLVAKRVNGKVVVLLVTE